MAPGENSGGRDWTRTASALVATTAAYNVAEAAVGLWAGIAADSVSLIAFALDSFIELAASLAMLWHLRWERQNQTRAAHAKDERRIRRFIGATFIALAAYVCAEAGFALWRREIPDESSLGIVLAVLSLAVMPAISWAKLRAADRLDSPALRAEAKETLACTYLSFVLLLGLTLNAWLGWWWADAAAAALMLPWLVHEGIAGLRARMY